jgi:integrase/recombinase XerD
MAKVRVRRNSAADLLTLYEAFDMFIAEKEADNKAPTTIISYERTFKAFCSFYEFDEDSLVTDVTESHIFKWKGTMKQNGLRPASINHYIRDIRTILYWCMDDNRQYLEPFKIKLVEETEEIVKHYSDEEIEILLQKPRKSDSFTTWRCWAIVNWIMATGNRASTVCEIKMGDINFNKKEITLRHTKAKKQQIIPLSSSLESALKEYIRIWRKDASTDDYLFANISDEKLTTNALRLSFETYTRMYGIEKSSIHALRHTFAKGWVKNNGNMFTLQKVLGHSKLDMTRKYVKQFAEDLKEGYDAFSPLDTMKKSQKRTNVMKRNRD